MKSTHVFIGLLAVLNLVYGVYIKDKKDADGVEEVPVNGGWSDVWIAGECSKPCGGGVRKKYRECNNPKPQNGGAYCKGTESFEEGCNAWFCPVDCVWSDYTLGSCDAACGWGTQTNERFVVQQESFGGRPCTGPSVHEVPCFTKPCADADLIIDGGWSDWVAVTPCTEPCGGGARVLRRECDNPFPRHGGVSCVGPRVQFENCNEHECPVHCAWDDWNYGECSVTCGGGTQIITRDVLVEAEFGGEQCEGEHTLIETCNTDACPPIDCQWGEWFLGECSVTCGEGQRTNTREVEIERSGNGEDCPGSASETVPCTMPVCEPDPCVDTYNGNCGNYVWACTDVRYSSWFPDVCRKTCDLC